MVDHRRDPRRLRPGLRARLPPRGRLAALGIRHLHRAAVEFATVCKVIRISFLQNFGVLVLGYIEADVCK